MSEFSRLSPDGQHFVGERAVAGQEHPDIIIDDTLVIGRGIQPSWFTNDSIGWVKGPYVNRSVKQPDGFWRSGLLKAFDRGLNGFSCNAAGRWAVYAPSPNTVYTSTGQQYDGCSAPCVSPEGDVFAVRDDGFLAINGVRVDIGGRAGVPRVTAGGFAWVQYPGPFAKPDYWGQTAHAHIVVPVATTWSSGDFLLVLEDARLILRRKGTNQGKVVFAGEGTFNPDAVFDGTDIVVCWTTRPDGLTWTFRFNGILEALNDVPLPLPAPAPAPVPVPVPPAPSPSPMPESLLDLVRYYTDIYQPDGSTEDDPRYGLVLNAVAREAGDTWGLIGRHSGGGIVGPSGDHVDFDGLWHRASGRLYDVFAGDDHHPSWGEITAGQSPDNYWVSPILLPLPAPDPGPGPLPQPPAPAPVPPAACKFDVSALRDELAVVAADVQAYGERLGRINDTVDALMRDLHTVLVPALSKQIADISLPIELKFFGQTVRGKVGK